MRANGISLTISTVLFSLYNCGMPPMIKNPDRRTFIKKSFSLLSTLSLFGCGGGSNSSSKTETTAIVISPSIIAQPTDQSILSGESTTFRVLAEGSQPLSYRWRRNGVDIPGATSPSYTTPTLTTGDGALFSVTVKNSAGTVTSRAAQLTVAKLKVTVDSATITVDSTQLTVDSV